LTSVDRLRVSGRTSSFSFKGKSSDLAEIGRKLNVSTVLEGSVRRAGSRVRITAQLVSTRDGFHLWSRTFDRELTDVFAVQEDSSDPKRRDRARDVAERAVQAGPALADAYAARGFVRLLGADWQGAQPDLERALTMKPGDVSVLLRYGNLLATLGRLPDAILRRVNLPRE
jgi:tetratricopeptide (TPR) repeat protein